MAEDKILANLMSNNVTAEMSNLASESYEKGRYGELKGKKYVYSLLEALYLVEREKMVVSSGKKIIDFDSFMKKAEKAEKGFWVRYCVFRDLRDRGYIVKTALKFGADFRVYDKGVKPGEDHAKWVVYPVYETDVMTWYDFSAKNRVAHSTKKSLLIAIIDHEGDVTYYDVRWTRP